MSVGPAARSWLREEVRAFYGSDREATRIEGTVIAYSAGPQVLIEALDGERDWWDVGLCEKTTETNRLKERARMGGPAGWRGSCSTRPRRGKGGRYEVPVAA